MSTVPLFKECFISSARMRSEGYSTWSSVRPSVCYHVFCHYAQQGGQKAMPTGSVPHWLDFKNGDFRKSTAFKSYGLKTKRTSQYSSTVEAVHVTRRTSTWSWFAKNTIPTNVASPCVHCFPGSCVSVQHAYLYAYFSCTPPRVQHFSAFHYAPVPFD